MVLLLIVPLFLLWFLIANYRHRIGFAALSVRGAFVLAFLAFQVLLLAITELTSLGNHFTARTVAGAWLVVIVILAFVAWTPISDLVKRFRSQPTKNLGLRTRLNRLSNEEWVWIGVVVVILGVLAVVGSIYPPSNTDSLVYHLARVEHWIQNRSVAPFATHDLSQVELSPASEYNLAHLHLLLGTDRLDWTMQWMAALVSVVGVSELARLLGAQRRAQIAASVVCVTIPSGILLAPSTENDYFGAAIGIGFLILLTAFSFGAGWGYRATALGVTAGLAYMAKGTVPALLAPAAVALLGVAFYRHVRPRGVQSALRRGIALVFVIIAGATAIAGPFIVTSAQSLGAPDGPTTSETLSSALTIDGFGANVVRSTAANFDIGNGANGIDTYVSKAALGILRPLYSMFGIAPDNNEYSFDRYTNPVEVANYTHDERVGEVGANPWDVLLIIGSIIVLAVAVAHGAKEVRVALVLGLALAGGFLLFSGLKSWSTFNVRFTLPLLVAWSAVIAIALSRFSRWITRLVLVGLVIACCPQLFENATMPLVPTTSFSGSYLTPYFVNYSLVPPSEEASSYQTVTTMLGQSTCTKAAIGNWVFLEYPLWVGLQHEHWHGLLNAFDVHNVTSKLEPNYVPCAWITQQGSTYVTPNNGTVNVHLTDLALSIEASKAITIRASIPSFESGVPDVHVLPGGGWVLNYLGHDPILIRHGSLYLFSPTAQSVQLQLNLASGVSQPSLDLTGPDGIMIPTVTTGNAIYASFGLHRGINRVTLTATGRTKNGRPNLVLTAVKVDRVQP